MHRLAQYDENYIVNYWIYLLYEELKYNHGIEYSKFNEKSVVGKEVFFETLKEYYSTYMYQNVNGAKFVDLWNKKAGFLNYTNSKTAISAASPLRGPSLKICVYPPLRSA